VGREKVLIIRSCTSCCFAEFRANRLESRDFEPVQRKKEGELREVGKGEGVGLGTLMDQDLQIWKTGKMGPFLGDSEGTIVSKNL
jgi:hypothetical protein